jgi:hypothetical protein
MLTNKHGNCVINGKKRRHSKTLPEDKNVKNEEGREGILASPAGLPEF